MGPASSASFAPAQTVLPIPHPYDTKHSFHFYN